MLVGVVVGAGGCGAPRRRSDMQPGAGAAAKPRPAALPAIATVPFDKLGPLPDLPAPAELVDRTVPPEALKHYLAGLALAEDYQDTDAIPEFEAAIAADPAGFEPRLSLGRAALRAGDQSRAQSALETAVKQRPRSSEIHYLLGLVAAAKDDGPTALQHLRRCALVLAGDDGQRIRVYFHLAQVLEHQDYCQAAVEIARRFEVLASRDVAGLPMQPPWRDLVTSQGWRIPALRGACLRRLGRPAEAVEAFEAALKVAPDRTDVMLHLAETLIDVGDSHRAADLADKVVTREPGNTTALALLAATLAVDGRQGELRERLLALVHANPSDMLLAQRVAAIFLKFGQLDPALQALLIARKGMSEPAPVYAALMQIVLANDDLQPAVDGLAGLLEQLEPAEQDELLGPIDILQINPKLARDMARQGQAVLAWAGTSGPKLLALGVIAGVAGQHVLAESALRAALRAQPDSLLIASTLGEQILAQSRWKDAIAFAEPLTGRFKDSGAIYRILGTRLRRPGRLQARDAEPLRGPPP